MTAREILEGVCVLRLDAPPMNTLTFQVLEELTQFIQAANGCDAVSSIVITGRPDHFSSGADIGLFEKIGGREEAMRLSRVFQDAFGTIERSEKPVVAAVAGAMMGGALELAMACHARICAASTRFSMPEVNLGFNPGAGGTQRLPRLIGTERAMRMLVTGESINAEEASRVGLVDAVVAPDELLPKALAMARAIQEPARTGSRTDRISDSASNAAAFGWAEKHVAGLRAELVAPREIAATVRTGIESGLDAGLKAEQTAFARCVGTTATRNKIYLFFATRQTAKVPELSGAKAAKIGRAAVVGMGSMGTGIAHALIIGGVPVKVLDEDKAAVSRGIERIKASIQGHMEKGKMPADRASQMMALIEPARSWDDLADADIVIEAVFEDAGAKQAVYRRIEGVCGDDVIVASNTSTISLDVLAREMRRPQRLVGMHFFNPAHRMPLVEVIRHSGAAPGVVATVLALARAIRKTPVLVNNREGFIVNRLFIPYLKEAFLLLEEGAAPEAIDRAMVGFGFPMGPLALIDMAGIDILVATDRVMSRAFPDHGRLSQIAVRLVEDGHLGQKTGAGVYKYGKGNYTPGFHEATARLIAEARSGLKGIRGQVEDGAIEERLVLRMVAEASHVLDEGVARGEADLDVATVLGIGFPDFRGGVMRHARDLGLARVGQRLEELASRLGPRFTPGGVLKQN